MFNVKKEYTQSKNDNRLNVRPSIMRYILRVTLPALLFFKCGTSSLIVSILLLVVFILIIVSMMIDILKTYPCYCFVEGDKFVLHSGFWSANIQEIEIKKIKSIVKQQSIFAKIFGYMDVSIIDFDNQCLIHFNGIGETNLPLEVRKMI
ncbi:MAG: hypothetical protein DI598_18475 [Pseudopedobacter saltans]|uniref:YdbS-like PH domain-containing protein n=1 Tax=Pseudopedobacter saltans TaxID=151895 RepID=A0A2W5G6X1_9SPHI|nr:MAG: hypothetical protein DI598_18475 [Pseudopedobacter saltans]